jgi:phage shock protein E
MSYLIGVFLILAYIDYEESQKNPQKITVKEAKNKIKDGAKVLDVRSPAEYFIGHYENSINLPSAEFTEENLKAKYLKKNDTIVVYCNSGTRARKAAKKLKDMGYKNVFYIIETYLSLK